MLGMIGLPPLIGFISKWYILLAFLEESNYVGIIVVVLGSILSVLYYFRYVSHGYEPTEVDAPVRKMSQPTDFKQERVVINIIYIFTALVVLTGIFYKLLDVPLMAAIRALM
jgi:multicomponent Na+:H+ antiporter subunit D